jgi:LCP family protein required for cell wall assembly
VVEQIRTDLDVPIHHYAEIGFGGFADIVDALGGVAIHMDNPVRDTKSGLDLPAGDLDLSGAQAVALIRARAPEEFVAGDWQAMPSGDLARVGRQQEMIAMVVTSATRAGRDLLRTLPYTGLQDLETDPTLTLFVALDLARRVENLSLDDMDSFVLPVETTRSDHDLLSPFDPPHLGGRPWFEMAHDDARVVLERFRDPG